MKNKIILALISLLMTGYVYAAELTRYEAIFDNNSSSTVTMTITGTDNLSRFVNKGTQYEIKSGQPIRLVFYVNNNSVGHVHFSLDGNAHCAIRVASYSRSQDYDMQFRECTGVLAHFNGIKLDKNFYYTKLFA